MNKVISDHMRAMQRRSAESRWGGLVIPAPKNNTMKTKHTPGPWRVIHESADPDWSAVVGPHGGIVANVNAESGPDIPPLVSRKNPLEANARLIAAAPELLEALEEIANACQNEWAGQKARAAIAKATGGRP